MTQITTETEVRRSELVRLASSYDDVLLDSIDGHNKELRSINEKVQDFLHSS